MIITMSDPTRPNGRTRSLRTDRIPIVANFDNGESSSRKTKLTLLGTLTTKGTGDFIQKACVVEGPFGEFTVEPRTM